MSTFTTPKGTVLPILNLRGKDYLQVQHRIVWFTEERPDWSIHTSIVERTVDSCLACAEILDEKRNIRATAHKFEDRQGFGDFIEKSETGAIGRALALLGFGTQFCADDLDEADRLADAPALRVQPDTRQTPSRAFISQPAAANARLREPAPPITKPISPVIVKPGVNLMAEEILNAKRQTLADAATRNGWASAEVSGAIREKYGKHLIRELSDDEYDWILEAFSHPKIPEPQKSLLDFNEAP